MATLHASTIIKPHWILVATTLAASLCGQMEKRWSGLFHLSTYEMAKPRVGRLAPELRLFDLDGKPRNLAVERGRRVVLLAGSFT